MSFKNRCMGAALASTLTLGLLVCPALFAGETERLHSGHVIAALARVSSTLGELTDSLRAMNARHSSGDMLVARKRVCEVFNGVGGARSFYLPKPGSVEVSALDAYLATLRRRYLVEARTLESDQIEEIVASASAPIFTIDSFCRGQAFLTHAELDRALDEAALLISGARGVVKQRIREERIRYERLASSLESEVRESKTVVEQAIENAGSVVRPLAARPAE